ncbi:MAG: metallophosphoesterase family protein [Chlamydiales bacterium]
MRIAHLSDLHFAKLSLNPFQFFSKRWLGNLNLLFFRRKEFDPLQLNTLPELFKSLDVKLVIISGDLSTTSRRKEFRLAQKFVEKIRNKGIQVVTLPGNHDQYTKCAYKKKLFYKYFNSPLKDEGVMVQKLEGGWNLIALDAAIATSLASSRGLFSQELERSFKKLLSELPEKEPILLVNHFPFFQHQGPRKSLERGEALRAILKDDPRIKLYLQGHTHLQTVADLRPSGLPIILDSGSATQRKDGHFHLLDLSLKKCVVEPFQWTDQTGWKAKEKMEFIL